MNARAQGLIYTGIDEAGYGPRLGPLCVASATFAVESWEEGDAPPDLWALLASGVGRTVKDAQRGLIAVNDSKAIKLSNQSRTRHPLLHLETGVLAFLAIMGAQPETDAELFETLGVTADLPAWYGDQPQRLPVATTNEALSIRINRLRSAVKDAALAALELRCVALDECEFNQGLKQSGSKANVSFDCVGQLLDRVWRRWGEDRPRVVIDRQGGRRFYESRLEAALAGSKVDSSAESRETSFYALREAGSADPNGRTIAVRFEVEADARHFPVALASMCAKYVRELLMARFNKHWAARLPEIKPTAGYGTDARRWLDDMGAALTPDERRALVRRA